LPASPAERVSSAHGSNGLTLTFSGVVNILLTISPERLADGEERLEHGDAGCLSGKQRVIRKGEAMRSGAQTITDPNPPDTEPSGLSTSWERLAQGARRIIASDRDIRAHKSRLAEEHRDLDDLIAVLADELGTDEALITRLKKRKLSIRDEIARADAMLLGRPVHATP